MTRVHLLFFPLLLVGILFMSCSEEKELDITPFVAPEDKTYTIDKMLLDSILHICESSENRHKSIGTFGGSWSNSAWTYVAQQIISSNLAATSFHTFGVGGEGYATDGPKNIVKQVEEADNACDIYILTGTSNDWQGNSKIKDVRAAITYCITKLREINPEAKILYLGGLKFFSNESGYIWNSKAKNKQGLRYSDYLKCEMECAQQASVPYLNQFDEIPLAKENYHQFYLPDAIHPNRNGYEMIGYYQLLFIASH